MSTRHFVIDETSSNTYYNFMPLLISPMSSIPPLTNYLDAQNDSCLVFILTQMSVILKPIYFLKSCQCRGLTAATD
jgi:hypothetical protein